QFIGQLGNPLVLSRRVAVLDSDGLSINVAERFEPLKKRADALLLAPGKKQYADPPHPRCRLRARRERPSHRRAATQCDEIAPLDVRHELSPDDVAPARGPRSRFAARSSCLGAVARSLGQI